MKVSIKKICDISLSDIIKRSDVVDTPEAVSLLRQAIFRSEDVWYGFHNDEFACAWGVIPPTLMSDNAYLWLITTPLVAEHKFTFIRQSQIQVQKMLEAYDMIIGDVIVDNEPAKQWLRWLGAEFGRLVGKRLTFVIRRK